ncbi:MAG: hypothetical protein WDN04_12015 [Rhodospirillales bacterium]
MPAPAALEAAGAGGQFEGDLTGLRGHAGAVERLVQMRQILLQGMEGFGALHLDGDVGGAVVGALDTDLHGAEFGGLQVDRYLARGAGGEMHGGGGVGELGRGRRRRGGLRGRGRGGGGGGGGVDGGGWGRRGDRGEGVGGPG